LVCFKMILMYNTLLIFHSLFRWLVLLSLIYAIGCAGWRFVKKLPFTKMDNVTRHWTATLAHLQLMLGILLYTQSPVVKYYFKYGDDVTGAFFFGIIHIVLMLVAIILITIGSAMAKRKTGDEQKFKTILLWYSLGLLLILIAIPWPFSPLAQRPYMRFF
jgi:hypothetical protein